MFRSDLRHLLIYRDCVAIRRPELAASQPDGDTIVMMAKGSWVMQAADGRDHFTMLFQRLQ